MKITKKASHNKVPERNTVLLDTLIKGGIEKELAQKLLESLSPAEIESIEKTDFVKNIREIWNPKQLRGLTVSLTKMLLYRQLREDLFIELLKLRYPVREAAKLAGIDYWSEQTLRDFERANNEDI
jgi:hypothetical protein